MKGIFRKRRRSSSTNAMVQAAKIAVCNSAKLNPHKIQELTRHMGTSGANEKVRRTFLATGRVSKVFGSSHSAKTQLARKSEGTSKVRRIPRMRQKLRMNGTESISSEGLRK